jgi:threonyl-tRNA synthetase
MIYRAPFGSMERFMGILIEHFAGAFPLWLAPEQVRVLPISEKVEAYGRRVLEELQKAGLRAAIDLRSEKIGAKIRDAQLEKLPAMLVVGQKEAESGLVSYRDRTAGDRGAMPLGEVVTRLRAENDARTTLLPAGTPAPDEPASGEEQHLY